MRAACASGGRPTGSLSAMLLPELKQLAQSLGITGASTMRKSALIEAISAKQSSNRSNSGNGRSSDNGATGAKGRSSGRADRADKSDKDRADDRSDRAESPTKDDRNAPKEQGERERAPRNDNRQDSRNDNRNDNRGDNRNDNRNDSYDDDADGSRRRRRRGRDRFRDRRDRRPGGFSEQDMEVSEDDVLVPVAGILDVLDNYAFVRTAGYLPSPNDVYVSLSMVKKNGLRKGDAVTGAVKQPRDGERASS